jgi:hypothetical protein
MYEYPATEKDLNKDFNFVLTSNELEAYREPINGIGEDTPDYQVNEPEGLRALRRYLMLAVLGTSRTVDNFLATQQLEGKYTLQEIGRFLLQVIDYNLEELPNPNATLAMEQELLEKHDDKAKDDAYSKEHTSILYRILYRDALAQWRHVICRYYQVFSAADECEEHRNLLNLDFLSVPSPMCLKQQGYSVCGSSIAVKRCARCQQLSYCCKEHQTKHWLTHKPMCMPIGQQQHEEEEKKTV